MTWMALWHRFRRLVSLREVEALIGSRVPYSEVESVGLEMRVRF